MCLNLQHSFTDLYQKKIQRGWLDTNILSNEKQGLQKPGDFKPASGMKLRGMLF